MGRAKANRAISGALEQLDRRFGAPSDSTAEEFREQAEVAEMLYAARTTAGLTQKELAQAAGTTQQVISQLEDADYQGHSLSMLRRIATALGSRVEIRLVPDSTQKAAS